MPYSYPPSDEILRFGKLQESSHFYVVGFACLNGESPYRIRCNFEVGYTTECQIIVVCYPPITLAYGTLHKIPRTTKFFGKDIKTGLRVFTDGLSNTGYKEATNHSEVIDCVVTFHASYLRVHDPENDEELSDTTPYTRYFDIVGLDIPSYFDRNHRHFDPDYNGQIKFPIDESKGQVITVLFKSTLEDRLYNNQPTGQLMIPPTCIPIGWRADHVADAWCALISLAVGRDIQWTSRIVPLLEYGRQDFREKIWWSRSINGGVQFHFLITRYLAKNDNALQIYFQLIFKNLMQGSITQDALHLYNFIVRHYVEYINVGTTYLNGTARLVTTLIEEFLYGWINNIQPSVGLIIDKAERSNLEEVVRQALNKNDDAPDDYLTRSESKQDRTELIERVIGIIHSNIREKTFLDKLLVFFKTYGHANQDLTKRLKACVATRNSITHRGKLSWHDDEVVKNSLVRFYATTGDEWVHEYHNALMIIPLMILSVFGYRGFYSDMLFPNEHQEWGKASEASKPQTD